MAKKNAANLTRRNLVATKKHKAGLQDQINDLTTQVRELQRAVAQVVMERSGRRR